jgi:hypothetical protein
MVVSIDLCRISNWSVAGLTLGAQRVPNDRRKSWALAQLPH